MRSLHTGAYNQGHAFIAERAVNLGAGEWALIRAGGMLTYKVSASGDGTITIKPFTGFDDAALQLTYSEGAHGTGPMCQEYTTHVVVRAVA
jgi:hypothetical protein